ncbi:uncharacterized protein LOC123530696 [Mercenaria mercenaria]|uniref:uncharacterized protein LOC123530696 n=1 Tax=Mercenaria mercenaria TaxID=6596 RepID=UPI00234F6193|nr:uncharacterized protein LOC123530696 [Mercenaria mercenaria]
MIVFKFFVILFLSVSKIHSQTVFTEFVVKILKCDTLYGEILGTSSVRYFPQCVQLCEINEYCQSNLFNEVNGTCQANRNLLSTDNVTQECGKTLKYAERRNDSTTSTPAPTTATSTLSSTTTSAPSLVIKKSLIEKECFDNSGCPVSESSCMNGVCRCSPGYSYDCDCFMCCKLRCVR